MVQERRVPDAVHHMSTQTAVPTKGRVQTCAVSRMGEQTAPFGESAGLKH